MILRWVAKRMARAARILAVVSIALLGFASASNCTAAGPDLVFSNTFPITINDAPAGDVAKASPYPSVVHVSGVAANTIT